jgi:hypothetical protein
MIDIDNELWFILAHKPFVAQIYIVVRYLLEPSIRPYVRRRASVLAAIIKSF